MDFDEVLTVVGSFGRYQKWLVFSICICASVPASVTIFTHIFVSAVPSHHCHAPVTSETTSLLREKLAVTEDYDLALRSLFVPRGADGNFASCQQYDIDVDSVIRQLVKQHGYLNSTILSGFVASNQWPSVQCRNGWDYDTSEFSETVATKFDVVCDRAWLVSTSQSAFFVGAMLGSLLFGWISDKWGRRPALLLSTAVMVVGNLVEILTPNYTFYIAIRFIVGLIHPSVYSLAFLIVAEVSGVSKRMLSSVICHIAFAVAMLVLAVMGYFLTNWRTLQATYSIPMLLLIAYYWVVPESPRWLVARGRIDEAEVIVQRMAKVNGVSLPPGFLRGKMLEESKTVQSEHEEPTASLVLELLRFPKVALKLIVIALVWTITVMVYHGMSFAVSNLPAKTYVAFFLSGVADIPGILLSLFAMERYGRRNTMLVCLFAGGVCSTATAFIADDLPWLTILFPSLAKFWASATVTVVYTYAGEIFPTVFRGFAIGASCTISQIGLALTPYILYLGTIHGRIVPFTILGVFSMLAAFLLLTLPETLNMPLPTTMYESEHYAEFVKRKSESGKPHHENHSTDKRVMP